MYKQRSYMLSRYSIENRHSDDDGDDAEGACGDSGDGGSDLKGDKEATPTLSISQSWLKI